VGEVQSTLTCDFLLMRPITSGLNLGKMVTVAFGLAIMNDASLPCRWGGSESQPRREESSRRRGEREEGAHKARVLRAQRKFESAQHSSTS